MNNAKKLAKNGGVGTEVKKSKGGRSIFTSKNEVLLAIGIITVLILCVGVCYMQLRPRAVLKVTGTDASGSETTNTVYMKDTVFDIYQVESQYNQYSSIYQQLYGTTYWEMEDADGKGRSGKAAAKKQVMDGIKQREILYMEAQKLGYKLTDEEKKSADANVQTTIKGLTDAQKKIPGLDEKSLTAVFEKSALANKYRQIIIQESGIDENALKASVKKEDYRQYTLQYYMVSNKDGSGKDAKDVTPEQKQTNMNNMKALQEKAKTAKDFTKLVDQKDTTGIQYSTQDLIEKDMKTSSFLTKDLRKQIVKMNNNDISDVIEGEDGYYLVKMVNNNDSAAYDKQCETVVSDEQTKQFNAKYEQILPGYTTEVQSYWKGRVTLGGYTTAE